MQPWNADEFTTAIKRELDHGTKYFSTRQGNQPLANVQAVAGELREHGRVIMESHVPREQLDKVIDARATSGEAASSR
jgi:hypothetical protein